MSYTTTDLIHRTLRNLGALPQGQSPSAEEVVSIGSLIDSVFADLKRRNIVDVSTAIATEHLIPLGHIVANAARTEFGATNGTELFTLAQKAEQDLLVQRRGKTAS